MPRQPRYLLPGYPQHVIQRGNNRQPTFRSNEDFAFYKRYLAECAQELRCRVHAYVLMTNHVHLVITPKEGAGISKLMQSLGRRYVYYFNKTYDRTGTLWEGRYKACIIDTEGYLLACYRYVELNPVRAGLVSDPAQYPHSSHAHNIGLEIDDLVTPHAVYKSLGSNSRTRQTAYRNLFGQTLRRGAIDEIRKMTNSCLVLGSEQFRDHIELVLERPVRQKRPGRPPSSTVLDQSPKAGV